MTPREIHDLGVRAVSGIEASMLNMLKSEGAATIVPYLKTLP
jgi:uncharacterized protein (DUF885 family)